MLRNGIEMCLLSLVGIVLASAPAQVVRGRVEKIDSAENRLTIKPIDGRDVVVKVTDQSRLQRGRKPIELKAIEVGQRVRVDFQLQDGENRVMNLRVRPGNNDELSREVRETL